MDEIRGVLFSVIVGKGSRSEGPKYYIRPLDDHKNRWSEILVRKKTKSWENDSELHKHLEKPVLIRGEIIETKSSITVDYIEVKELKTPS
ncbi:MAG: hypothetical protein KAX18_13425 [Candidatus Lokiarchaeota archaeon]|nr:hypothetical protein [Candidatus Lokiarchaeota archaeon]